jgi:DNA polymerase III delta subunit
VKILAILVRQFRMVERCQKLMKEGIRDPKVLGQQIGTHPFFVGKIQELAKSRSAGELERAMDLLATTDYELKTGQSRLFEGFITNYFSS